MSNRLEWVVEGHDPDLKVKLTGSVDEESELSALLTEIAGKPKVRFDLRGVDRINSCGVREWVNFMRAIPTTTTVDLESCSPPMVNQINMIPNFIGAARVLSVLAPYVCEACGHEEHVLIGVESGTAPALAARACARCGKVMQFDELEESFFSFVGRRGAARA